MIDDSEDDLFFLRRLLVKAAPNRRQTVFWNPDDAVRFFARVAAGQEPLPLLAFVDIKMPARDGFDVLGRIRATPELDAMAVCMLSSSGATRDVNQAGHGSADCYLVKLPTAEELAQVVAAAERKAGSMAGAFDGVETNLLLQKRD